MQQFITDEIEQCKYFLALQRLVNGALSMDSGLASAIDVVL